ncbi:MAG TPA: tetratricopeptide repeat protein [Longimicrobium sp.]|nr:tetratricopeptide repeat protein [Longimicrobium sp.]
MLQHEPGELLEGASILDEFRDRVGMVLWQSLRDVTLWAETPVEARDGLFTEEAGRRRLEDLLTSGAEPTLEISLSTLAALVSTPATAAPEIISLVCLQVSEWADLRGAMATAVAYAQAAAVAFPEDPDPALAAGTVLLRWKRHARAETWLRRCIGLARRAGEWTNYAEAYQHLGRLFESRGDHAGAERYYVKAIRAARRHGLYHVRGAALHGLMRLRMEAGALVDAERLGRAAVRASRQGNVRTGALMHDLAYVWVKSGEFAKAIPVLKRALPARLDPQERALTLSILAHAGAETGDQHLYRESWMDAWTLVTTAEAAKRRGEHAQTFVELMRASVIMRDWAHVEQVARYAGLPSPRPAGGQGG